MRAKEGLADCLLAKGDLNGAIKHHQEMLELNPHDNQGIRHQLILCLFRKNLDEDMENYWVSILKMLLLILLIIMPYGFLERKKPLNKPMNS